MYKNSDTKRKFTREVCKNAMNKFREPLNKFKHEMFDSTSVCKADQTLVTDFINVVKESFAPEVWDLAGGTTNVVSRIPLNRNYNICVYDIYKALRDAKVFSIEKAYNRIKEYGVRKPGLKYTRKNARGHFTQAASPTMKAYTQSFCSEFNYNWRMILTLGSRLCAGRNRELDFKTSPSILPYVDAQMAPGYDNKFSVQLIGRAPQQANAQIRAFLDALDQDLFRYTFSGNVFLVTVRALKEKQEPIDTSKLLKVQPLSSEQKDTVLNSFIDTSKLPYFKFEPVKPVMVEDHFYSEMEKSVNEMSTIIDDYDRQIDKLSGKVDKIRVQRSKLLKAMQELRK